MTTALSSSSRLPTMAERSPRPGTSGTLNRTCPDHPCVVVTWHRKIATTRFKSSGVATSFDNPSLLHASLNSPGPASWGRMQCPKLSTKQSVLMLGSFMRDSFTDDVLLSAWDQLPLALSLRSSKVLEVQLVQLAFHKGQVCTCEQVEV